jgi:hypothetical protein
MIEEFGGGVGVRSWASILDEKTREQAEQTALLPILTEPIALMSDVRLPLGRSSRPATRVGSHEGSPVAQQPCRGGRSFESRRPAGGAASGPSFHARVD